MDDGVEHICTPQEEVKTEWRAIRRRTLGTICVGLATLVLLTLAIYTLLLLPAALDWEGWRGSMIALGIQTAITILPWYFAGISLLKRPKNKPSAVLRVIILLNIPLQVLAINMPLPTGIRGVYEYERFVSNAMLIQAVLAVSMAFILNALWLKQKDRHKSGGNYDVA